MKNIILLCALLTLSGCATVVPVTQKFPEIPATLKDHCSSLDLIEGETTTLSNLTKVVTINYTKYHECAAKVDAWVKWYRSQKDIFNSVK
jgi:uncharacterized protein YceK